MFYASKRVYRPAFIRKDIEWEHDGKTWFQDKTDNPVRKAMEALLPSIVFFLDLIKCYPGTLYRSGIVVVEGKRKHQRDFYKWTPRAIISIESQIMIECCTNLWKKYPKMFLITVHDCIKCLPKDVEKVRAEMIRTFEKYHVTPQLDVKEHKRPSDLNG